MTKFLVVKNLGALRPVDENGEAIVQKLGQGELVEIELRRPRNLRHHRKFWALMSLVWEQLDHAEYPNVEALVTRIKIAVGHRTRIEFSDGTVAFIPRSISFAQMDQSEFDTFFEACCDWIAAYVLPGVTREDLLQELEVMIGARAASYMSYQAVEWALGLEIPPTTKLVLVAMARRANKSGGDCWPGVSEMAQVSGRSERAVQYALRYLETKGFIECMSNSNGGRGRKPVYRLVMEKGAKHDNERVQPTAPIKRVQKQERVQSLHKRVQTATEKGANYDALLKDEAVLKQSYEAVQYYMAAFSTLSDVQGFKRDAVSEEKAAVYLQRKSIPQEQAEDAANAILSKVIWERGKWVYWTHGGKQSSGNLYGLFKNWAKRPPLAIQSRASPNGARASPGELTRETEEQARRLLEQRRKAGADDG